MRYIPIDELSVPTDWLYAARAAAKEVSSATPEDRSRVIDKNQAVWKELKEKLRTLSHEKCWYCESIDVRSDNAVDHYRPKGNVKGAAPPHEGYWWLAFNWRNYRFACTFCNSWRTSATTSGGKHDYFPLWNEGARARSENDELDDELPLLLDPTNPIDIALIAFADDGSVGPAFDKTEKPREYQMGLNSIKHYHLDHPSLTERRAETLRVVRRCVEEADKQLARHTKDGAGFSRQTATARIQDIMGAVSAKAVYSTAVKHLLAARAATQSAAAQSVLNTL